MVRASRSLRVFMASSWLWAAGCTTLREIPPGSYARVDERKHVAVETRDGQQHEFDFARFGSDSLTGFTRRDVEGEFDEYTTLAIQLEAVSKLSARRVDWYRTGLVGGALIAAVVVAAITRHKDAPAAPVEPCTEPPCPP